MPSISNVQEGNNLIDAELNEQLATGCVDGFHRALSSSQVDVFKLRSATCRSTVLHIASCSGHVALVNVILSQWPELMIQRNSEEDLPIHSALKSCKMNVVDVLMCWLKQQQGAAHGVSVHRVLGWNNVEGNTALHIALESDDERMKLMARDLVDLYPPASCVMNNEKICPLYMAIKKEFADLVRHMLLIMQPFKEEAFWCLSKGHSVLHAAVSAESTKMLEHLLSYDDNKLIYLLDEEGWTALSYAASIGKLEKVQIFHSRDVDSALVSNEDKSFPIHQAVLKGHISIISLLTSSRFLLNGKGQNILHLATLTGDSALVSYVLSLPDVDSLINQNDEDGNTPLHLATLAKHEEVVEILIQNEDVNVGLLNKEGLTPNDLARTLIFVDNAEKNVVRRLNLMLERATMDIKSYPLDGKVHRLVVNREITQVSQIVSGGRLKLKHLLSPEDGSNVLHIAACMDNPIVIFCLLLEYNCASLMYQANKKGDLPIHSAVKTGKLGCVKALFQWSYIPADRICERQNMDGNTALHVAVLNNQREIASYLYKQCPQAAYCLNRDNICPLFLAIQSWKTTEIDLINRMIQGFEGNVKLQNQLKGAKSVVDIAIIAESKAILESIIVRAPGLFDSVDSCGRNPLSFAALVGYVEGVKILLKNFPDLEFKRNEDKEGSYPIHEAVNGGNVEVIKLLHPENCLLNSKGQNILHVAAELGKFCIVKYLLRLQTFKEQLNTGDDDGNTPLHLAVKAARPNVVFLLVHHDHFHHNSMNKKLLTASELWTMNSENVKKNTLGSLQMHLMNVMLKNRRYKFLSQRKDELGVNGKNEVIKQTIKKSENKSSLFYSPKKLRKTGDNLMVVATLIITVSFAAIFSPPGGFDQNTGFPILSKNKNFASFVESNRFAFHCAVGSAIFLILGNVVKGLVGFCLIIYGGCFTIFGINFLLVAFSFALRSTYKSGSSALSVLSLLSLIDLYVPMAGIFVPVIITSLPIVIVNVSKLRTIRRVRTNTRTTVKQFIWMLLFFCPPDEAKPDISF